jgi:SAM-dependent methyltransferase
MSEELRMYSDLAPWWHLLSVPEDYADEAAFYRKLMLECARGEVRRVLELGSGGGNNASHLKAHFEMTLVDRSSGMQAMSRKLNPECEHVPGDMRDVRLGREFDAVFVHDAVSYITSEEDLRRVMETAAVHCRVGGAVVFCPDYVRETFKPGTSHGGHDGDGRAMRYLEWVTDPDPNDSTYTVDYAFVLREEDGSVRVEHDRHVEGLFSTEDWLRLMREAGFEGRTAELPLEEGEPGWQIFAGVKV